MLSSPLRGERPAFAAGRLEESVRHSPQSLQRRESGILIRQCRGERRAFSAVHAEECRACSAVR